MSNVDFLKITLTPDIYLEKLFLLERVEILHGLYVHMYRYSHIL